MISPLLLSSGAIAVQSVPRATWTVDRKDLGPGLWVDNTEYKGLLVSQPHQHTRSERLRRRKWRPLKGKGNFIPIGAGVYRFSPSQGGWSGGGPFYTWQRKVDHGQIDTITVMRNGVWGTYKTIGSTGAAPAHASHPGSLAPSFNSEVTNHLGGLHATGFARTRPGNPVASLGVFLSELAQDGLPSLPGKQVRSKVFPGYALGLGHVAFRDLPRVLLERLNRFRYLGSEYLNIVFGWKPFISDLRKMYYLMQNIDRRMAQLVRENKKNIHRKARLENDKSVSQTVQDYSLPYVNVYGSPPGYPVGKTHYTLTTTTKTKSWYSASYKYYIQDTSSWLWDTKARLVLFGAFPTPEVIYNALPWTWLLDWFTNVGDLVSNISPNAVDALVINYAFVMREVVETVEAKSHIWHSARDDMGGFWPSRDKSFTSTMTTKSKMRAGGSNPFGLGVQLPSLTTGQLGILGALGISRGLVR